MDPNTLAPLFRRLNPTLWLITAGEAARSGGLIATFVAQAGIVPELPRMLVGLSKRHRTWELVAARRCFGMHLLAEDQIELAWRFGTQSRRDVDKLAGLATFTAQTGTPLLREAIGWMDCRIEASFDTGDRTLHLVEVLDGALSRDVPPLTMHRFLDQLTAEQRSELKRQLDQDARLDATAIQAWRQEQRE